MSLSDNKVVKFVTDGTALVAGAGSGYVVRRALKPLVPADGNPFTRIAMHTAIFFIAGIVGSAVQKQVRSDADFVCENVDAIVALANREMAEDETWLEDVNEALDEAEPTDLEEKA